jgi:hypothetical protein
VPSISVPLNNLYRPPVALSFGVANGGDSKDLSKQIKSLTIDRPWSGQASFAARFINYNPLSGALPLLARPANTLRANPPNHALTEGTGALRHHDQTPTHAVSISLTVLGQTSTSFPTFLGGGYQDDMPEGAWPGYDFHYFLDVENQNRADIVDSSPPQMAKATWATIAGGYGGGINTDLRFPDYRIRQLRMHSGTPRQWCEKIGLPFCAGIRFNGSTMIGEQFVMQTNAQWGYKAGVNFTKFKWKESEPPPRNRFTLNRLDPQKGILGKTRCIGGKCSGRTLEIDFSSPSRVVKVVSTTYDGQLIDWVFVGEDGSFNQAPIAGQWNGIPVVKVLATFEPTTPSVSVAGLGLNQTITVPPDDSWGYSSIAYGGSPSGSLLDHYKGIYPTPVGFIPVTQSFPYAPSITTQVINPEPVTVDQTYYGICEDFQGINDPILPDKATMDLYGNQKLLESVRKTFIGTLETPFVNPLLEPGHWVEVEAPLEGWPDKTLWHVEHVHEDFNQGTWSQTLTLTAGLWLLL